MQAFSSTALDVAALGVDLLTLAAHKFGGPERGRVCCMFGKASTSSRSFTVGVRNWVGGPEPRTPWVPWGWSPRCAWRRPIASISPDGWALERDAFEGELVAAGAVVTGADQIRLPQHAHVRLPGITNETLLVRLDGRDLDASAGSACQSGAVTVSHVLDAMGWEAARAAEAMRFTFGWTTRPGDGKAAAQTVLAAWR